MKNRITLAALIAMSMTHSACRTSKNSSRQQTSLTVQEQAVIKNQIQETNDYIRSESLIDSNGQSYQLTIFPADTFQFSLQNGFIGKATKVVLSGTSHQLIRVRDTSQFSESRNLELESKIKRDSTLKTGGREVMAKRRGGVWFGIGIGLIAALILLVLGWKLKNRIAFL